jgi:ribosomal protein L17
MFRNMVTSLFLHGKIRTTDAKAKELRKVADKLITLGKRVTQMHKQWMADRGSPNDRMVERDKRKLADALTPLMKQIETKAPASLAEGWKRIGPPNRSA